MNKPVPSSSHLSGGTAGGRARRTPALSLEEIAAVLGGGVLFVAGAYLLIILAALAAR